jgi:hypothetical protein
MAMPRALARTNSAKSSDKKLDVDVTFIPKSLTAKCRHLVERYHAVYGYANLPDILWQPGPRDLIETYYLFDRTFKRACTVRSTRRANEGFVEMATTILSLEVLASDFTDWSTKYPAAKQSAHMILRDYPLISPACLMERYVFSRSSLTPASINALASSDRY